MLIDTHCHLTDPAFDPDRDAVIDRMRAAGIHRALVVESVPERIDTSLAWLHSFPDLRLAVGAHPHDASRWDQAMADRLEQLWHDPLVCAAGEMGLDYHYDHAPRDIQRRVFSEQLGRAVAADLPVIIHAREADADVVAILAEQPSARVVLHSFSSGDLLADAGMAAGWYFSFSGMVTFRSWDRADLIRRVPSDRLLVETDAPYLAPVPHRGMRNEPAFVVETARKLAEIRAVDPEVIAAETATNALRLFWGT